MYKIFMPSVSNQADRPQFGVIASRNPGVGIPWYNYVCTACGQTDGGEYFPMVWGAAAARPGPECAGKPLLFLNEPEFANQANMTPAAAATLLHEYRNWTGRLYGFGAQHTSWDWFNAAMTAYTNAYHQPLPLTGIHLHVYSFNNLRTSDFTRWRKLADTHGWDIVVSEIGHLPIGTTTAHDIANALPGILDMTIKELKPSYVFWFSLVNTGVEYNDGFHWARTALYDTNGETVVGKAWREYTGWRYRAKEN